MTRKEIILRILGKYGNNTGANITKLMYDDFPGIIEVKRHSYTLKNVIKTEKDIFNQLSAEIGSIIYQDSFGFFEQEKPVNSSTIYNLSEKGIQEYITLTTDIEEIEEEIIDTVDYLINVDADFEEELKNNKGVVYLLRSINFPDTYKIGMTSKTVQDRIVELTKDKTYAIFNLEPVMCITCNEYLTIERVLHKFFEDFRLDRKNGEYINTELFKNDETIELEFELFYDMLEKNPRYNNISLEKFL